MSQLLLVKQSMKKIYKEEASNDNTEALTEIVFEYLKHWKWFVVSITIALIIAIGIIVVSKKQYKPSLSVLLNEEKGKSNTSSELMGLESLGLLSTTNNIENEIIILGSPDLMELVVKALNVNVSYYQKHYFRETDIYTESPFIVKVASDPETYKGRTEIQIQKNGDVYEIEGTYFKDDNKTDFKLAENKLPTTIPINEAISLELKLSDKKIEEGEKYYIVVNSITTATTNLVSKLGVVNSGQKSSIVTLSLQVNNTKKGIDILNELVRQYNGLNLKLNNEIAYNTGLFINDRLKEISRELSDAEENVVEYKQQHKIADLSSEAQLFVAQTGENETKLLGIETQLNILNLVQKFISDPNNNTKIIPNIGISDLGLSQIISEYNAKLLASDQLIKGTGDKNPSRLRILEELSNMRNGISNSLVNVGDTYRVGKAELEQRGNVTNSRILSVPKQEKGLIEKVREQKIKENLFLFLMQKREETNLSIAATSDKARIVISAQSNLEPVAPKSKVILLACIVFGGLIPIILIYVRNLFKTKISNRDEFERMSNVSIIGEVGINTTNEFLVVKHQQNAIAEMFRSLRNNVKFVLNTGRSPITIITSTVASEGKSFVSVNLALSFAYTNKKVLLIGGDIRSPKIHEYLDVTFLHNKKGLSDYLASNDSIKDDYICIPFSETPNFNVLVAGTIPPNPNELLMSPRLKGLLEELKNEYDYIFIDSAPVGLVSDSYLIGEYADISLYVVRENKTPKTAINFINMQLAENKLKNMYVILNDTALRTSYKYGYGKGYGYGKN